MATTPTPAHPIPAGWSLFWSTPVKQRVMPLARTLLFPLGIPSFAALDACFTLSEEENGHLGNGIGGRVRQFMSDGVRNPTGPIVRAAQIFRAILIVGAFTPYSGMFAVARLISTVLAVQMFNLQQNNPGVDRHDIGSMLLFAGVMYFAEPLGFDLPFKCFVLSLDIAATAARYFLPPL